MVAKIKTKDEGMVIIGAESERLILRGYKKEDLQDLFEYLSDKEVVKYEPYKPQILNATKENLKWRIGTDEIYFKRISEHCKGVWNSIN